MDATLKFGIVTVSDTCYYREPTKDKSGPALKEEILKYSPRFEVSQTTIVPDEMEDIKNILKIWSDSNTLNVILTTGGTGFSRRDITPEATLQVIEKEAPGLSHVMTANSLKVTPMAMLSRAICGIRGQTLIINLPGSSKGATECFGFIREALPHAVAVLTDRKADITEVHRAMQDGGGDGIREYPSKVKLNVATRERKSPYPMIEVSEATKIVLRESIPTKKIESISFDASHNRILAEDVYALEPIPPFRASIKDGYAVRAEDGAGDRVVRDAVAAGNKPLDWKLGPLEAIRISTGAPVPPGANAVVQVEDTSVIKVSEDGSTELTVRIEILPKIDQDIRQIGSDISANSLVLSKHQQIGPYHIGVLAMLGKTTVMVFKRPTITVISTGNELVGPRDVPEGGQIRDANKYTLMNLLEKFTYKPIDGGIARDNPDSVKNKLEEVFRKSDILISSGGVSMGEFDILKQVLVEDFGAKIHFGRVNMKPGKPTTFATLKYHGRRKLYFGLPGNPVSCGVTCLLYIIPAVRQIEQNAVCQFPVVRAKAPDLKNTDPRPEYHRVQVKIETGTGDLVASSTGNQISSRLNSLVGANGLALVHKNNDIIEYKVILFDSLIGTL